MYRKQRRLMKEIQLKREVMIKAAKEKGTTDQETVRYSQELDELIYQYQLLSKQVKRKVVMKRSIFNSQIIWANNYRYCKEKYTQVL